MTNIFAIIPLICFTCIFLIIYRMPDKYGWRCSFLLASIVWGVLLTVITELLSLFHILVYEWVIGLWALAGLITLIILLSKRREVYGRFEITGISPFPIALILCVGFIVSMIGLIALTAPPNNWDSMTYHMSRVVHWIQNQTIDFYPTPIQRQLHLSPWAEFAIMHFQILSFGDYFANLVQWFSMVGSILGVTLITRRLGGDTYSQILSAVITATIPMGILQASGSQNDYVVSFWLVSFVYFTMQLKVSHTRINAIGAGGSLGLALLTKGTAYLFAFPFLAYFIFSSFQRLRWKAWKSICFISVFAIILNLGHYARNLELYGSPLGPGYEGLSGEFQYANTEYTLPGLISNIVRNIGLQISTPIERVNSAVEDGISHLHTLLGMGVNDVRTTWTGTEFHVPLLAPHEDFSGNPIHLLLIGTALAALLIKRDWGRGRELLYYFAAIISAFIMFSFYLKWQPWHSRLHLPLFVLLSASVAVVLSGAFSTRIVGLIAVILILSALPWIFLNISRPVIAPAHFVSILPSWVFGNRSLPLIESRSIFTNRRTDQYFSNRLSLQTPYREAADFVISQKCREVGLTMGGNDWEYPFWVLLQSDNVRKTRIEHLNVKNISAIKSVPDDLFTPCAIISVDSGQGGEIIHKGHGYTSGWSMEPVRVFVKERDE